MADQIQVQFDTTSIVLYAVIRNAASQVWNGTSFGTYATASLSTYTITLTEQGTASRYYAVNFPSAIAAGIYSVVILRRSGASPAETDPVVAGGAIDWDGTNIVPLAGGVKLASTQVFNNTGQTVNLPANTLAISGSAQAADNLKAEELALVTGTVNDAGATTTVFKGSSGLSSTDNWYGVTPGRRSVLAFQSGSLQGLAGLITGYAGSTRQFTFSTAFPAAPANGDPFIILGLIG